MIFLQIIVIVANVVDQRLAGELQNAGGRLVDEIPVVGHVQDGAGVAVQRRFQDFLGGDVQMVGGLVQNEKIGFGEHELCQGNTTPFTAAQVFDPLEHIIPGKEECCKHISDLCFGKSWIRVGNFLKNSFIHMKNMMFLVIISDLNFGTQGKLAGICLDKSVDDLQHRCFSGSVIADKSYTFPSLDIKRNIRKEYGADHTTL